MSINGLRSGTDGVFAPYKCNVDNYCHNRLKSLVGVRGFEPPAPASRTHLGIFKYLLLIGILETLADVSS